MAPEPDAGRIPAAGRAALVGAAIAAGVVLAFRWTYEPDLFWHLAQGREIAAGRLVRTNLFSATYPDLPQPSTSWLFDFGTYALWQVGGGATIQAAQALVVSLALVLVVMAARRRAPLAAALAVAALGVFVIEPRALPRPHTVSLLGMAACAFLVETARAKRSAVPLVAAVPVVALWSNLHVECFFGIALIGLFAAGELVRPTVLGRLQALAAGALAALAAAATVANPYGPGLLRYLWANASVPSVIRIAELQSPYLPNYAPFFLYLLCGAALLLRRPRSVALWEALVCVAFAWLALRYLRFTALSFCATAPVVAAHLARFARGRREGRWLVGASLAAGLLVCRMPPAALFGQLVVGSAALVPPDIIPVGAAEFSRTVGLAGPLFNSNNIGGYLIWGRYPDVRVFQDARLQAYPPDHFRKIMTAYGSQQAWDALVAGVDWAVLSRPRPNELSGAGRFPRNRWATVYWDEAAEVLVRRTGTHAGLIATHEYTVFLPETDPLVRLDAARAARAIVEAQRNMGENPPGFAAPAVLCLHGDEAACAAVAALTRERPVLHRATARLEAIRATTR
jgi:hypothetical protein